MLAGVNDSHVEPDRFALPGLQSEGERRGLDATIRLTRGREIDAGGGKLAARS